MLYSIIISAAIAAAVIGLFCIRAIRLDKCRRSVKSYVLIPACKNARQLDMLVRSCYWEEVFRDKGCARDIILLASADEQLTNKAKSLELQFGIVHCVKPGELESFLKLKEKERDTSGSE